MSAIPSYWSFIRQQLGSGPTLRVEHIGPFYADTQVLRRILLAVTAGVAAQKPFNQALVWSEGQWQKSGWIADIDPATGQPRLTG